MGWEEERVEKEEKATKLFKEEGWKVYTGGAITHFVP